MARYIDADALIKKVFPYDVVDKKSYAINAKTIYEEIQKAPTVNVAEVVRCKDCKWYRLSHLACVHPNFNGYINVDGYCSYGERKEK